MLKQALHYSHELLTDVVQPGDHVVDATVGNGFDTKFLAQLVGESGQVYGFDVQKLAIERTSERLLAANLAKQTTLYHAGHETLASIIPLVPHLRAAIFNLGYLPQSDKQIITHAPNTLKALNDLLPRLLPGGRIIVVVYYGHEGGETEKEAVLSYLNDLPQAEFNVLAYHFINQKNNPPILLAIEKKTAEKDFII